MQVSLLAWRGLDAMIRGREVIERRVNEDLSYTQLIRQFDRDCQEIVRRDELNISTGMTSSANSQLGEGSANLGGGNFPSLIAGAKTIWWLRHYQTDMQDSWLLVGYGMGASGLQRWTSQPLLRRDSALNVWSVIVRDPDLLSSDLLLSWQAPNIVRQSFKVQAATVVSNAPINSALSLNMPDQQGITIQWWLKDVALPITRSCLMGGAL
jgi:hypothetical protein